MKWHFLLLYENKRQGKKFCWLFWRRLEAPLSPLILEQSFLSIYTWLNQSWINYLSMGHFYCWILLVLTKMQSYNLRFNISLSRCIYVTSPCVSHLKIESTLSLNQKIYILKRIIWVNTHKHDLAILNC